MTTLLSRFQGSLVGAVVGDCIGAVFEGLWVPGIAIEKILRLVKKIETAAGEANNAEKDTDADNASKKKIWEFTDDTAMARSVASSLIENKGLNSRDMAKRFVDEYFAEPHRGYGASVGVVFQSLKECDCLDLYGPASRQFDGSGSYGNGGAMRISPLALYGYKYNDQEKLKVFGLSVVDIYIVTVK
ncbi:hypothetical protein KUTeg_004901 [Tegillarca granosa]|uniref:ADP-ribosylhydrolase ARH3 n=1 Tax=Tegillarca granosa TaxID=220873 RepID=A0ABQ9FKA5_TEGGR|nr:hypothetical protein KUTeg_004901 [Tegillarca granosa]